MNPTSAKALMLTFAREDLGIYSLAVWPNYDLARHLKLIANKLMAVERGEIKRLIINMPPRHGKSLQCSQLFPAWYLGRHTDHYIINVTYGQDLSLDFGRAVRNFIDSPNHREIFPECVLAEDAQSAARFALQPEPGKTPGIYYSVGRNGPITGRGAHLLIIDDPLKDEQEAQSETIRRQLKEWYQTVAFTRLQPNGAIIICTTRWHVDDLPGYVLMDHADEGWDVLSLPALAEGADPLGRADEEALWPERYNTDYLTRMRAGMEARFWLALYQQRPAIEGGYTFHREWWKQYDEPVRLAATNRYILVDPANSKKKDSDSTVMWVIALSSDMNYYVVDCVKDRLGLTERVDKLMELHRRWRPIGVGYEQYGMQADIEAIEARQRRDNYRFDITQLGGKTAKTDRIRALEPAFREGRIFFPKELYYRDVEGLEHDLVTVFFEQEYLRYPAVKHDDMLDGLARLLDPKLTLAWPTPEMYQEFKDQNERYRRAKRPARNTTWMSA